MKAYEGLMNQVELFIKRFYINRLIRGAFIFVGVSLLVFLVFVNLEYFGSFRTGIRATLFFSLLLTVIGLSWFYIVDPVLKLMSLGGRMTPNDAAVLIGKLLPEIDDKVLNTIQLYDLNKGASDSGMIEAAIKQKALKLSSFSFGTAIDFKENRKYLKFVLPILLVFFSILFFNPQIIQDGSTRIVNYQQEFLVPAPFDFVLVSEKKSIEEGVDYSIEVKLDGEELPNKVFVQSNYGRFLMTRNSKNTFVYTLPKVKQDVRFYFDANGFKSNNFEVVVHGSSKLSNFKVFLDYPDYTGLKDELVTNPVNMSVPEGTRAKFSGQLQNVNKGVFSFPDTSFMVESGFSFITSFYRTQEYKIVLNNSFSKEETVFEKQVEVIKDEYPIIDVQEVVDTNNYLVRFLEGVARDDYGLSKVVFVAEKTQSNKKVDLIRMKIPGIGISGGRFYHMFDLRGLDLKAGEELSYYFVAYDNDGVNGSKQTTSKRFYYTVPTNEQLKENREEALANAQAGMSDLQKELKRFEKSLDEFRKANLNKRTETWKKKDMLDKLFEQQKSLQERIEEAKQELSKTMDEKDLFDEVDEELLKKQELLEEMLDRLLDDEMKELLKELQELMEKNNDAGFEDKMKEMELSKEEMNREMDRTLEMLKKMDVEERLNDAIKKLDDLQKKQEELSKKTENNESPKQEELNEEFEKLKEELKKTEEKNQELKRPFQLDSENDLQKEISDDMNDAKDQLDKGKDGKANEPQKGASEKMSEMKESLQAQLDEQKKKQTGEDLESMRSLLENLMRLSFDQEDLIYAMAGKKKADPILTTLNRRQRKVMDDHVVVKDSLVELAKRVPQISGLIDGELRIIERNFDDLRVIDRNLGDLPLNLHDREIEKRAISQQFIMTSYNNLALMLNEALEQMQQQMQSMMSGSGSCDKPGGKGAKPSEGMGDMKEMLKKQLEKMKGKGPQPGEGEKGDSPGGTEPGGAGGMGLPGMSSKEIAKMAAEQGAMRKMLEKLRQEMNKDGKGTGNSLNPLIEELEKQEKDLVNRNERFLIQRQQEILTRLLESEKAMQEREWDDKRQSETAKNQENRNLIEFSEYKKRKEKEIELLRSKTPGLNSYYRQMAVQYFNKARSND